MLWAAAVCLQYNTCIQSGASTVLHSVRLQLYSGLELGLACSPLPARHPIRSLTLSCWTKVAHTSSPPCEFCGTHALMIVIFGHCRPAQHSNISPTISHEASHQPGKTSSSAPPPRSCHCLQYIIICLKKSLHRVTYVALSALL